MQAEVVQGDGACSLCEAEVVEVMAASCGEAEVVGWEGRWWVGVGGGWAHGGGEEEAKRRRWAHNLCS